MIHLYDPVLILLSWWYANTFNCLVRVEVSSTWWDTRLDLPGLCNCVNFVDRRCCQCSKCCGWQLCTSHRYCSGALAVKSLCSLCVYRTYRMAIAARGKLLTCSWSGSLRHLFNRQASLADELQSCYHCSLWEAIYEGSWWGWWVLDAEKAKQGSAPAPGNGKHPSGLHQRLRLEGGLGKSPAVWSLQWVVSEGGFFETSFAPKARGCKVMGREKQFQEQSCFISVSESLWQNFVQN